MCGREAGDDIVQDTFLAVLRQTARQDTVRGSVEAYLLGIGRHLALKRLGSDNQLASFHPGAGEDRPFEGDGGDAALPSGGALPSVLDDLARAEIVETVRAAVQSLPSSYREVVVLCELDGISYAAAAGIVRCPLGTVRSRLHRARMLLTAKLATMSPAVRKERG
jgi:RNA polymerase sigma-70 factor (ECF subfamily)